MKDGSIRYRCDKELEVSFKEKAKEKGKKYTDILRDYMKYFIKRK